MRVRSVIRETKPYFRYTDERLAVRFEHNGVEWEKFFPLECDEITYKNWFNSLIEDVLARTR